MNAADWFFFQHGTKPIPPPPSRDRAIQIREHFQGDWFQSRTYTAAYQAAYPNAIDGAIPYFGASLCDYWIVGDGPQILNQLLKADDITHVQAFLTMGPPGYNEKGQAYGQDQIVKPSNAWGSDWPSYLAMVDEIIRRGKCPHYVIYAEGDAGYQWTRDNLAEYVQRMQVGYNRLQYGPVSFAFDSVWPDTYSVARMKEAIPFWSSVIRPAGGYLGCWFSGDDRESMYLWVEDETDYTKPWMDGLDVVIGTDGPGEADCISMANKARYMVPNPNFDQCKPDQGGSFLLFDNSQGPRCWLNIEYLTRQCTFDPAQTYKQAVLDARQRMKNLNCLGWG